MTLCQNKRGIYKNTNYLTAEKAQLYYDLPLAEIIFDFYDKLKSTSKGYASLDYQLIDFVAGDLKKLDILINNEIVDALSIITHSDDAYHLGVTLCSKLKELIPRQMFDVPIQASLGSKIISRCTVRAVHPRGVRKTPRVGRRDGRRDGPTERQRRRAGSAIL